MTRALQRGSVLIGSDSMSLPFHFYKESEISGELFAIPENYHYFCYGGKIYGGNNKNKTV